MKKLNVVLVVLLGLSIFALSPGATFAEDQIVLKLGHSTAPDGMLDKRAQKFAELVAAKTDGKVKIEIYPAGQLGHIKEILQGVSMGTIDMAQEAALFLDGFEKDYSIITTCFLFTRDELKDLEFIDELRERVRKKAGIRTLPGKAFRPAFHLFTKKRAIETPDKLQGSKIRVWQSKGVVAVWNGLGAAAVSIPWQEVYMALSQNVADGMFHNIVQVRDEKFYEQLDYCIKINGLELYDATWINDAKFQSLSPDIQKALSEASQESADWGTQYNMTLEDDAVKQMSNKIKFVEVDDRKAWTDKAAVVAVNLEKDGVWSEGLLKKLGK
jgi:TRAP-type C4-dicarboxylate transport system substrate-binding protein